LEGAAVRLLMALASAGAWAASGLLMEYQRQGHAQPWSGWLEVVDGASISTHTCSPGAGILRLLMAPALVGVHMALE